MPRYLMVLLVLGISAAAEPPKLRLGDEVRPVRYRVDLTIIPEQDTFTGRIEIDLDVVKPTGVVWLNARNLTFDEAKFDGHAATAKNLTAGNSKEFAGFSTSLLKAGPVKLQISYHGEFNRKDSAGLFKQKDGDRWYAFTQFESIDARQAFPCFDEPSFKVPWQVTLHVKKGDSAVSNTPIVSETSEAGGRNKVVFAETKPLPSYLVAVAVGPFEFVDGGKAGKNRTPVRIVTPKGKAVQAKYAAEVTGPLLEELENYFSIPYPYEKLDIMAVPLFGGAMENAGLITYVQSLMLCDPALDSIDRQRGYAEIVAHEMAHQWFGDLVTTAWWNDIWLNEAFASWMASKVIHHWKPEWNTLIDEQNTRLGAMDQDSLISARQIRQPIESNDDIANAFDDITYSKGEAVIGMFERFMGEEAFQHGVTRYLRQYSWRNATAGDFLDSLGSAGNSTVGRPFSTFLDQPGVPLVSVKLNCDTPGGPSLSLHQKRALPLGSTGSTEQTWQIPVCVRYGAGDATHRACTLLTQTSMEWKLPEATACPSWVLANADGGGYYRARYEGDLLGPLLADGARKLSAAERVATLGDVDSLMTMGEIKAGDALALAPEFAGDPVRQVVGSVIGIASGVRNHLVSDELLPNYRRFIDQTFGPRARQLGWTAKAGEDAETRLLRAKLVPLVALWSEEPALATEARQLAVKWLADRRAVDPDIAGPALTVAARTGDEVYFKQLQAALPKTEDHQQRQLIIGALGSFRNPEIVRAAMEMVLKPDLDLRESTPLLFRPLAMPGTRALPFEFVKKNYNAIVARIPSGSTFGVGEFMPFVGSSFCDQQSSDAVAAFFEPKVDNFAGTRRNLAQVLESIRICVAYKAAQQASVTKFLQKY